MSNYTTENLIAVSPGSVPAGTPAIKVGDHVFLAGGIPGGEDVPVGAEFYAPLSSGNTAAETGQALEVEYGVPAYTTYRGVPCCYFDGDTVIRVRGVNDGLTFSESPLAISFWIAIGSAANEDSGILMLGQAAEGYMIAPVYKGGLSISGHGPNYGAANGVSVNWDGSWKHVVLNFGQGVGGSRPLEFCINGESVLTTTFTYAGFPGSQFRDLWLGSYCDDHTYIPNLTGYLAAVRIYPRVLGAAEIAGLYAEFTPTQS